MNIWDILGPFGWYFVFIWYILVSCTKKNLATLLFVGKKLANPLPHEKWL
jgi:hypothetical protein